MKHYQITAKSEATGNQVLVGIVGIEEIAKAICVLLNSGKSETIAEYKEFINEKNHDYVQIT